MAFLCQIGTYALFDCPHEIWIINVLDFMGREKESGKLFNRAFEPIAAMVMTEEGLLQQSLACINKAFP